MKGPLLEVKQVSKQYDSPGGRLVVLSDISFGLEAGESISVMGPSGCGKSTLLNILGALDNPTSGEVRLNGVNPHQLNPAGQAAFRNGQVGFVFQDHCLLPQLTVTENVLTPVLVGAADPEAPARARRLLDEVGLSGRLTHRPGQLSGGERQRVAIARALIRNPVLLLCDEPTGNLDQNSSEGVSSLLTGLQAEHKTVMVVVTHSPDVARHFGQIFRLDNGKLCASSA